MGGIPHTNRTNPPRARSAAGGEHRKRGFRSVHAEEPGNPPTSPPLCRPTPSSRQESASGGVGGGRHPPHEPHEPPASEERSRRRAPQARVPLRPRRRTRKPPDVPAVVPTYAVESPRVRFWGCGGWEASPTRTARTPRERGAQPEASTASEGSAPSTQKNQETPRRPRRCADLRRRVAKSPLLGVWGMGGIPHTNRTNPPRARSAAGGEHRKRGFRDEPRRKHNKTPRRSTPSCRTASEAGPWHERCMSRA